ncbi:MAG: hypothetical protein M1837_003887 [Sclerophora amabilis]|nr:MAG: hypothetical protein M1837_003887 [Sclerophora amabilis]
MASGPGRPTRPPQVPPRSSARARYSSSSIPDDFANLDELAGPAPIQNPTEDSWYEHRSLSEGRQGEKIDDRHDIDDDAEGYESSERTRVSQYLFPDPKRKSRPISAIPSSTAGRQSWLAEVGIAPPVPKPDDSSALGRRSDLEGSHAPQPKVDLESDPVNVSSPPSKPGFPLQSQPKYSRLATELYTVSYLIFFSLMGTLARLGVEALTFYPGTPLPVSSVWANFGGSLVMGYLSEDRQLFRDEWGQTPGQEKRDDDQVIGKRVNHPAEARKAHAAAKQTIPLYIGLATGFCGSFTSFSTFMRDVFLALSNRLPTAPTTNDFMMPPSSPTIPRRDAGYSVMAVLSVVITTIAVSLTALYLGANLAIAFHPISPTIPFTISRKVLDRVGVFLGWGCWIGAIILAIVPPDRPGGPAGSRPWSEEVWRSRALFSLVFAPLGCLVRFYASVHLNGVLSSFPLGTFACNAFGTAVLGMAFDLQRIPIGGRVGCQVLTGMQDGFCGCLTTVSTWVMELTSLRRRHAFVYGGVSVVFGTVLLVVIIGSLSWSVGLAKVVC